MRYLFGILILFVAGFSASLVGDNIYSFAHDDHNNTLPVYICDYVFLPKNETIGRTKDVFLIDICSDIEVDIDHFEFSNIPSGSVAGILYYPYKGNWSASSKPFRVTDWTLSGNTLVIDQKFRIYPSKHSNIFMIVYEDAVTPSQNHNFEHYLIIGGILGTILLGIIIRKVVI